VATGSGRLGGAVAYFPLVGLVLGAAAAGLDRLLGLVLPGPAAAVCVLAFLAIATGGLHLDGLADTADGLFAHGDRTRRLAAMRDSRSGAFGVAAVVLVVLLQFSSLSAIGLDDRAVALVLAATLSRWAMSLAVWAFRAARSDGLGAAFSRDARTSDIAFATVAMGLAVGALAGPVQAAVAVAVAGIVPVSVAALAQARLGGPTGDVYGAIGELVFACELAALSSGLAGRG
jgi:adenosylcobinamide-GDP ribazoletransferase